jgi:uncharacterized protein YggE
MKQRLLLLTIGVLFLLPRGEGWADEFDNIPKLVVRGEASVFKPADQMEVSLGVVTSAANSSQALNENNQRMHQIIDSLKALGLNEMDYQTGRFQIRPIYQKPPKGSEEDEKAVISRYEVINAIQIKTTKIALAEKILNAAVAGGANQINQVNFDLMNPQSYREEAIKLATTNALADASALASAAGVKLVRILNLSLDHWQQFPRPRTLAKRLENESLSSDLVDQGIIEPGNAEIHASVNVTMQIAPQ